MTETLLILLLILVCGALALQVIALRRSTPPAPDMSQLNEMLTRLGDSLRSHESEEFLRSRNELTQRLSELRKEVSDTQVDARAELTMQAESSQRRIADFLSGLRDQLSQQARDTEQRLSAVRETVEKRLEQLQVSNQQKLDEMRQTVDGKLHDALDKRIGESFRTVSERLAEVHHGLGEMKTMAAEVGDLKRVMGNVGNRGAWGEVRLGALLEQMLTRAQYERNVRPDDTSSERVEYAIRLPGPDDAADRPVWLPIDAKFPTADYEKLLDAIEKADQKAIDQAGKALETQLRKCAEDISKKYLRPPRTTDFALMFLPSEGLYAEALRRPGLLESLQREHRVTPVGPTTLGALLNSLQLGFRTLAIQKRSAEVWRVLSGAKDEFGKFGAALLSIREKIVAAGKAVDTAEKNARGIERRLSAVQQDAPDADGQLLFDTASTSPRPPAQELLE